MGRACRRPAPKLRAANRDGAVFRAVCAIKSVDSRSFVRVSVRLLALHSAVL